MLYGKIKGVRKPVSRIIQGSMMLGMPGAFEVLDQVFQMGVNAIDTAKVYNNESKLGDWIHSRGIRDELVIITKGAHHGNGADGGIIPRCNEIGITEDINASLEKLRVEHIDLYILHRDDPGTPVAEIVECLNRHLRDGRVHAFGGSNWSHERICEANEYAAAKGLVPFAVTNPNFSLAEMYREPWLNCVSVSGARGEAARRWYAAAGIPILAWSGMAGGFWSGNFSREMFAADPEKIPEMVRHCYCGEENFARLDRVREMAADKKLSVSMIANAYIFCQPQEVYALIAARSAEECAENIKSLDVHLTPKEIAWLEKD